MSYLCYVCSSLPPVVCRRSSCLIYVIYVMFRVYLQLFVGGLMSYLCYLCLSLPPVVCSLYLQLFVGGRMSYFCYVCSSLPPVVCGRAHVLFTLFVFVFTFSCL